MGRTLHAVLKLVLPKGSLERSTLELFEAADLTVNRSSSVEYKATIADPRVDEVRILRPQEIPSYVADGLFDLGIAGRDWVEETQSDVVLLGELAYSKATAKPFRIVVAVPEGSEWDKVEDLPDGAQRRHPVVERVMDPRDQLLAQSRPALRAAHKSLARGR